MRHAIVLCLALTAACKKADHEPLASAARACARDSELSCARPILGVRSLRASQAYYRDVLGFKVDWDYGDPPNFGSVSRGESVLFLSQGDPGTGTWTMIFARSVDALYDEMKQKGAIIKLPPTNMPWGLREMHVADPDENVMRFGSAIDGD
jgi:catechol 2,3-dioxygenase-like lactoylglutathione lyase family enzyme